MDRWSNQDSDEQRFANRCFDESASLGCGGTHFCQHLSVKNYLVGQVMFFIR